MVSFHPKTECKELLATELQKLNLPMKAAQTVSDGVAFWTVVGITLTYGREEIMDRFLGYCNTISCPYHWN
jgi:hypothetical protein